MKTYAQAHKKEEKERNESNHYNEISMHLKIKEMSLLQHVTFDILILINYFEKYIISYNTHHLMK